MYQSSYFFNLTICAGILTFTVQWTVSMLCSHPLVRFLYLFYFLLVLFPGHLKSCAEIRLPCILVAPTPAVFHVYPDPWYIHQIYIESASFNNITWPGLYFPPPRPRPALPTTIKTPSSSFSARFPSSNLSANTTPGLLYWETWN